MLMLQVELVRLGKSYSYLASLIYNKAVDIL